MRRALDRLKRVAIKIIDATGNMTSGDGIVKSVRTLLMDIATTMEALLSAVGTVRDLATHSLFLSTATVRDLYQKTTPHCLIFSLCWHGQHLLQIIPS